MAHLHRTLVVLALVVAAFVFGTGRAQAAGGNYVFQGGTPAEQSQARQALDASSFNWSIVPGQVTIVIGPTPASEAVPGKIFLDPAVLDSGEFGWGVVQHEYAHQVDFALLDADAHAKLNAALGGTVWCYDDSPTQLQHNQYGCERFASTIAWAYWQSPSNCMKPSTISGESGGMTPAAFRALLGTILGAGIETQPVSSQAIGYAPTVTTKAKSPVRTAATKKATRR